MTTRLKQVFTEASKLSLSEKHWDGLFARSQDALSKLASEALTEHRSGQTIEWHCYTQRKC